MAIAKRPTLLAAMTAREAVRAIRTSGADDRTKKQMINEWYHLNEIEQRERLARAETVKLLYGIETQELRDVTRRSGGFRQGIIDLKGRLVELTRSVKHSIHQAIFGIKRLTRLGG